MGLQKLIKARQSKIKRKNFIGYYTFSVLLTYIGVISGITGMFNAVTGKITYAIVCLIIAGVCDMFDGKVARMCKRSNEEKEFGIQIDSLADVISFIILPIIIGYSLGLTQWYHVIIFAIFAICGIARLGYFNIVAETDGPVKCYSGLPVTSTAIIMPLIYFFRKVMIHGTFPKLYIATICLVAFLFIYNFKIEKPTRISWYIVCSILAVLGVVVLIMWELKWPIF